MSHAPANDPPCTDDARALDVSLLLDDELPQPEVLPLIDHLLRCPGCATFYRRGRALEGGALLLAAEEARAEAEPVPPAVWERIRDHAGLTAPVAPTAPQPPATPRARQEAVALGERLQARRRRLPSWALPVAATLLLALGAVLGWQLSGSRRESPVELATERRVDAPTFAALASSGGSGQMNEERFVAIARELLAADSRYRDAMVGVLAVARSAEPREGAVDGPALPEIREAPLAPGRQVF